jgi:hypothetical protein
MRIGDSMSHFPVRSFPISNMQPTLWFLRVNVSKDRTSVGTPIVISNIQEDFIVPTTSIPFG